MTDGNLTVAPKLRFPEFRGAGDWHFTPLSHIAVPIAARVGTTVCVPMSITTGVGLVSQEEKFGRTIAGDSYKNYIRLHANDFAYNKSATKEFPQGYIARYSGMRDAAVPNSIFTCFRSDTAAVIPEYLDHLFHGNYHGRWLRKFITVGARAHGALSVSDDDLMSMPVPLPPDAVSRAEQQKIADCLGSLDDLTAAEGQKLETLRQHKNGLMQQLFPQPGDTVPRLRFPEFHDGPNWESETLGTIAAISSGSTPARSKAAFYEGGSIPWVKTTDLNNSRIESTEESITPSANASVNPAQSVLVAMYGGFKQIGRTGLLAMPAATNQALSVLVVHRGGLLPIFVLMWLNAKVGEWRRIASSSRKDPNIKGSDVASFPIHFPAEEAEQRRIADCLNTLDELIAAHSRKLDVLKEHKLGLLRQLFPMPELESR